MPERKYGLVVPCMKNFKGLTELMCTVNVPVQLVVVDNFRQNRGFAGGMNYGIKKAFDAGVTHCLCSNDDVLLGSRVFPRLAHELDSNPEVILATGCNIRGQNGANEDNIDRYGGESISDGPDFSCFMITPKTIEIIGWMDENFFPAFHDDNDFHWRIRLANKRAVACGIATMLHRGSQTQNFDPKNPVVPGPVFDQLRHYYTKKWGGGVGKEVYKHPYNDPSLTLKDWIRGR